MRDEEVVVWEKRPSDINWLLAEVASYYIGYLHNLS
jgi:hypothetical protein